MHKPFNQQQLPGLLLRVGLAFVFAYAAISSLQHPGAWIGFVPNFITKYITADTFLKLFAIFQLVLAVALLAGRYVKYAAGLATLSLAGLLIFNLNSLIVTFRDVGLICMAAALFFLDE